MPASQSESAHNDGIVNTDAEEGPSITGNRCDRRMVSSIWRHSIPGSRVESPLTKNGSLLYDVCTRFAEDEHDS